MANIAECAVAIAKSDLDALDGAFRRYDDRDLDWTAKTVVKKTYNNDATGETIYMYQVDSIGGQKVGLKKDGRIIKEYVGDDTTNQAMYNWLEEQGYRMTDEKYTKDEYYCNGWVVDFAKLDTYSYDYTPEIREREGFIVLFFGGRWDFPSALADKLNSAGVAWQGAGLDDSMDWSFDNGGNTIFGLVIREDTESEYNSHYIDITDNYMEER